MHQKWFFQVRVQRGIWWSALSPGEVGGGTTGEMVKVGCRRPLWRVQSTLSLSFGDFKLLSSDHVLLLVKHVSTHNEDIRLKYRAAERVSPLNPHKAQLRQRLRGICPAHEPVCGFLQRNPRFLLRAKVRPPCVPHPNWTQILSHKLAGVPKKPIQTNYQICQSSRVTTANQPVTESGRDSGCTVKLELLKVALHLKFCCGHSSKILAALLSLPESQGLSHTCTCMHTHMYTHVHAHMHTHTNPWVIISVFLRSQQELGFNSSISSLRRTVTVDWIIFPRKTSHILRP